MGVLKNTGLAYFWQKIKARIPTATSQLTNDSGFIACIPNNVTRFEEVGTDIGVIELNADSVDHKTVASVLTNDTNTIPTSSAVYNAMSNYSSASAISELTDVTLSNLTANNVLQYNGTKWINSAPSTFTPTDGTSGITTVSRVSNMLTSRLLKITSNTVNFSIDITSSSVGKYGTLPVGYIPDENINCNLVSNKGKACYIYINTSGEFGVTLISGTWASGDGVRFNMTYYTG